MSDPQHVSVVDLPSTQAVTSYLTMLDQAGSLWFLFVDDTGTPSPDWRRPEGIDLMDRQVVSWVRWQSPDGNFWYIRPSIFGTLLFSLERPMGEGTSTFFPTWWSPGRLRWTMMLSSAPALVLTQDVTPQALADQPHTVMACRTCRWTGHIDRSNARRDADGNPLLDRCPVDGSVFYPELEEEADEVWA